MQPIGDIRTVRSIEHTNKIDDTSMLFCFDSVVFDRFSHFLNNIACLIFFVGYGKSVYFWALVSALGTFFLGAGKKEKKNVCNLTRHRALFVAGH
jgi:hypothetical protein